jgi:hypothetical protein
MLCFHDNILLIFKISMCVMMHNSMDIGFYDGVLTMDCRLVLTC